MLERSGATWTVGVRTADDVENDDRVALLIDPVPDPIGATTRRPATSERGTERMADLLRVFAKRAVNKLPRGERDGGRQAFSQGPLRWWCHEQVVGLLERSLGGVTPAAGLHDLGHLITGCELASGDSRVGLGETVAAHLVVEQGERLETGELLGRAHGKRAVPAFDVVLRPTKSVSLLYGLGDSRVGGAVLEAHHAGLVEAAELDLPDVDPGDGCEQLARALSRAGGETLAIDTPSTPDLLQLSTAELRAERNRLRAELGQAPRDRARELARATARQEQAEAALAAARAKQPASPQHHNMLRWRGHGADERTAAQAGAIVVAEQQANRAVDREQELRAQQQQRAGWLDANAPSARLPAGHPGAGVAAARHRRGPRGDRRRPPRLPARRARPGASINQGQAGLASRRRRGHRVPRGLGHHRPRPGAWTPTRRLGRSPTTLRSGPTGSAPGPRSSGSTTSSASPTAPASTSPPASSRPPASTRPPTSSTARRAPTSGTRGQAGRVRSGPPASHYPEGAPDGQPPPRPRPGGVPAAVGGRRHPRGVGPPPSARPTSRRS